MIKYVPLIFFFVLSIPVLETLTVIGDAFYLVNSYSLYCVYSVKKTFLLTCSVKLNTASVLLNML